MTTFVDVLDTIRNTSVNPEQTGRRFENFSRRFLTTDPVWACQFEQVVSYREWARQTDLNRTCTAIDLVGKLTDNRGFAAIRCKYHQNDHHIQASDLDEFITAASKEPFTQLIFIDTTADAWEKNAEEAAADRKNFKRIRLNDFRKSRIDWEDFNANFETESQIKLVPPKSIRPHQQEALADVIKGFNRYPRGKLIMPSGTGKTFTSLKIAEKIARKGGRVLVLVPSLALMSQTIREWHNDAEIPISSFAVCSDSQVSKAVYRRKANADSIDANTDIDARDLSIPVTTDFRELVAKFEVSKPDSMSVVFSTYQSISVIEEAQANGMAEFSLIICDEAHRTTGVKMQDEDVSSFVKVHDQNLIRGARRLYMTATPRIFSEKVREKADSLNAVLCSMDDEEQFGPLFHALNFGKAVSDGLLTDYKVIVLAIDQTIVSRSIQRRMSKNSELALDDATKIVGCYRALQKHGDGHWDGNEPMRRAIMFCDSINASKLVRDEFENVTSAFLESDYIDDTDDSTLKCKIEHVDGTFNSKERDKLLNWLDEKSDSNSECRILSNARCLSEGVDVPDLDAILFMHPRKSQVDVVQAVGRVMRRSEEKKMGYIVLPVVIPAHQKPSDALNNNKSFDTIWGVLNALRSHDDRFDATINKYPVTGNFGGHIEVIAEISDIRTQEKGPATRIGKSTRGTSVETIDIDVPEQGELFDEFSAAMHSKIVQKCGNRLYWSDWANNIGEIAQNFMERIRALLDTGKIDIELFNNFLSEIQGGLNESVTESDAVEMLAQHFVTKPVFDALFSDYEFVKQNPVSQAMQKIIEQLELNNLHSETATLQDFYENVSWIVKDIDSLEGRQKIINTLYEKFFKKAFTKLADRLGIVYTPIEIVDFIIHSVNDILKQGFGKTLGSKGVHIIDPFTGTGTFITRLLQSNLITSNELLYKYKEEIHANEIVLLAYYIAAVNIESVFNFKNSGEFVPFSGICLTDTFGLVEDKDIFSQFMEDNTSRLSRQKQLDIKVIIGNPPYSAWQRTENENAKNVEYPILNKGIRENFVETSNARSVNALYDSYIKAIYWASERLGDDGGIIGFVTGNGWIDGKFADGMRKYLEKECSCIYIINLRGNIYLSMKNKQSGEGENVFGQGSKSGISIAFLVKNPNAKANGEVYYYDIGDDLKRVEKLENLTNFNSVQKLIDGNRFTKTHVDKNGDWLNKRDESLEKYPAIGSKTDKINIIFENHSAGVKSQRNAWCINSSRTKLTGNVTNLIEFFNSEVARHKKDGANVKIDDFVSSDPKKISWSRGLKKRMQNHRELKFDQSNIRLLHTKPFFKQWLYFGRDLNEEIYQFHKIFPDSDSTNRIIAVNGIGAGVDFSTMMCDTTIELHYLSSSQAFPFLLPSDENGSDARDESNSQNGPKLELNESGANNPTDGITNFGLKYFREKYGNDSITKTDVFHYIYGLLHSSHFKSKFSTNLRKELPRIPPVKQENDFWKFVEAGKSLADLHVNYEAADLYPVEFVQGGLEAPNNADKEKYFRVERMKYNNDKTEIIYNNNITLTGIPEEAYSYIVDGKSAIWSVINTQRVKVDKDSGIVNDPNDFAIETMNDPAYPLKLLLKIVSVSLDTMKVVNSLPVPEID